MNFSSLRTFLVATCAVVLASCGGGGGGGGSDSASTDLTPTAVVTAPNTVKLTANKTSIESTSVEGTQAPIEFEVTLDSPGDAALWLQLSENNNVIEFGDGEFLGDVFHGKAQLRGDLKAGTYRTEIVIRVCEDEACAKEVTASKLKLPLTYTVKDNIRVQTALVLSRNGADPAPQQQLDVTVPSDAGEVAATVATTSPDAFQVSYSNGKLTVNTRQVRSGEYHAKVSILSKTDARYKQMVDVQYLVKPPATGEHGLEITPAYAQLNLQQGKTLTHRFKVLRPTWTSEWATPVLSGESSVFSLRTLGNDEFEIAINGVGVSAASYTGSVQFDAGSLGGSGKAQFTVSISDSFTVGEVISALFRTLNSSSTPADLLLSSPIKTFDGIPATWFAVSNTPGLRVLRATGTTSKDPLQVQIDPAYFSLNDPQWVGSIDVGLDRNGTSRLTVPVTINNNIPAMTRVVSDAIPGQSGRIYIQGQFTDQSWINSGALSVQGAKLTQARLIAEPRMLTPDDILAIDVTDAVPGQPISISLNTPLRTTQVQTTVANVATIPSGFAALPYHRYRPAHYSLTNGALYFAGVSSNGQDASAFKWTPRGTTETLTSSASRLLGLDLAITPNGQDAYLYDSTKNIFQFRASDFQLTYIGELVQKSYSAIDTQFASGVPYDMNVFGFSADQRLFGSINKPAMGQQQQGAVWLTSPGSLKFVGPDLKVSEPGERTRLMSTTGIGSGIVQSPERNSILVVDPDGLLTIYHPEIRQWAEYGSVPEGQSVVGITESGNLLIRGDGVLQSFGTPLGHSLGKRLPDGFTAGGYGISPDGSTAFVYGQQTENNITQSSAVWVFDIRQAPTASADNAPLLGSISLPQPVTCATPQVVTHFGCDNKVSLSVTPGGQTIFVLGSEGVASLHLPENWQTTASAALAIKPASNKTSHKATWKNRQNENKSWWQRLLN